MTLQEKIQLHQYLWRDLDQDVQYGNIPIDAYLRRFHKISGLAFEIQRELINLTLQNTHSKGYLETPK